MRMSFWDSLRGLVEHGSVAWGFVTAAAIVLLLTPVTAWLAPKIGGVDTGGDRPAYTRSPCPASAAWRSSSASSCRRCCSSIWTAATRHPDRHGGVALVGLIDDTRGLRPGPKLLAVLLLTLVPVLGWHLKMDHLSVPVVGSVNLGWAAYPITILWIAFLANLVNLIDGMDGLAAGIVAIAAGSFALLAVSFLRVRPRGAGGHRLRRHAGVPAAQLPPREDLHG